MSPLLEPSFYGLWAGKQTAQGTPNTAPSKRLIQTSGDFAFGRDDGSSSYSDLTKYGANTDWVNSVTGQGEPGTECTPTELAYLLWLFHGAETVTAVTGPPLAQKHRFVPSLGKGHWASFLARVGQSVVRRHAFNDCLVTRFQIEASTGAKNLRIIPRVLSLDPGVIFATDPVAAMPTGKTLLYTDGVGAFTVDGTVFRGQSAFTFIVDDAWDLVYADDVTAFELVQGDPSVSISATVYMDAVAFAQWNKLAYGTPTPAAGTKPLKSIPALGSYAWNYVQRDGTGAVNGQGFQGAIPGVKWALPDAVGPNPAGGAAEVTLAGTMRPVAGQPAYTLDVFTANADTAFTV